MTAVSQGKTQASFGFSRRTLPLGEIIAAFARRHWPSKTAPNLASRTGTTVRAAEFILGGTNGLSGESLAELLRSDVGFEVLREVMSNAGTSKPGWWARFERGVVLADLEARHDALRAELAELVARPPR